MSRSCFGTYLVAARPTIHLRNYHSFLWTLDKLIDHIHRQQTPEDANKSIVIQSRL
ncbi:hypothetical protein CY34DRAFT_802946 [Suillus luteus UH-Slu-Lm8-n1]|uniref:Uncharacterized protein n=1 Tax=Suillus luteus UH-Slu-Lm8-n1 TaxID=930992 RepID=A0A0D0BLI6_9AGAM|nr:hypothetical protein CY34DRAFT_802946 [Suillus luteus UH-Slu-Lm8-n1]